MDTYLKNRILYDPNTKLHKTNGYRLKHTTWNEYQKLEAHNPWEIKKPLRYSRENLVRISGIKKGLYNPILPTLRKISRDDVLCKLSDEHSRHITCLDEEEFRSPSMMLNETQHKYFWTPDEFDENTTTSPDIFKSNPDIINSDELKKGSHSMSAFPSIKRHRSLVNVDLNMARNYNRAVSSDFRENINQFSEFKKLYSGYQNHVRSNHSQLL